MTRAVALFEHGPRGGCHLRPGGAIDLESQFRQRTAGLRTKVLVAVGAAAVVELGARNAGSEGAERVVSYAVFGIGFLGAGVIMKEGAEIRGLNTAATLWGSAAVGAFAGGGRKVEAVLVAAFVSASSTLLRPLVDVGDRRPIKAVKTEALHRVHLVCRPETVSAARDHLFSERERHHDSIRDIETLSQIEDHVERAAALVPTCAEPQDLDLVVDHLQRSAARVSATWTASATA